MSKSIDFKIHTQNTHTLINFFKNDYEILGRKLNFCINHYKKNELGFCQCYSEEFIGTSSNPKLMRSFMLCATFFDQFFFTHYQYIYKEFSSEFDFPKIYAHGLGGHASPSWFVYRHHGFDKKADWDIIKDVLRIISRDIMGWIRSKHSNEYRGILKNRLYQEIYHEFEEFPDAVLINSTIEKFIKI